MYDLIIKSLLHVFFTIMFSRLRNYDSEQLNNYQRPSLHPPLLSPNPLTPVLPVMRTFPDSLVFYFVLPNYGQKTSCGEHQLQKKSAKISLRSSSESRESTNSKHVQTLGYREDEKDFNSMECTANKALELQFQERALVLAVWGMMKKQLERHLEALTARLHSTLLWQGRSDIPQSLAQAQDFGLTSLKVAQKLSKLFIEPISKCLEPVPIFLFPIVTAQAFVTFQLDYGNGLLILLLSINLSSF